MVFQWHDLLLMLVPVLISIITKPKWNPKLKYLIAIVACFLASLAEFYLSVWIVGGVQGTFWAAFAKSFLIIFATYAGILKLPIPGLGSVADKVERDVCG